MKAGLVYANRLRWRVVPLHDVSAGRCSCHRGEECHTPGKHPRLNAWVKEASADPTVIAQWVEQWPAANVGLVTGESFFVLDIDGPEGAASLAELEAQHGPLPRTVQAQTGSGGTHYLFAMPDFPVSNDATGKVAHKIDVRGVGGQIVAPPSRTLKGPYRWVNPPWSTAIAPAPAWLLEILRRPARRAEQTISILRGCFPPAGPKVLHAAATALERHGPAVEGRGGDDHTFRACAILTHDFALSDDEAWPLLTEWNAGCVPSWSDADLRTKLASGAKYGRNEYGCKRTLDTIEAARFIAAQWQASGEGETDVPAMRAKIAALPYPDQTTRAIIERELYGLTGLKAKALDLPPPRVPVGDLNPGQILVTVKLNEVADDATQAIAPRVFQRGGVLCEVSTAERTWITDLEPARIQDLMSQSAEYVRDDPKQGRVSIQAPGPVAAILHARRGHQGVRVLESITTAPVFLADGSILQTRGYNKQARVFLEPSVAVDVPEAPTIDDARAALALLCDLVCDFKFVSDADRATWIAALLSPLVKAATGNAPAPLICISASSPGAGKSLLAELICRIVTGQALENRTYGGRTPGEEWAKKLTAYVRSGTPISVFDNINGPFGPDEGLDRLITSSTWSDRILGASEAPPLPIVSTWLATGNNIEPHADTVRRVLICRFEVDTERPQERTGFKRPELAQYAQEHRGELLSAALTLLRAFHVAGRPAQRLTTLGSFEAWSGLVRAALVWAGQPDPYLTQQRASADLNEAENDLHDWWIGVVNSADGTRADIAARANQANAQDVLRMRDQLSPLNLQRFIGRFIDKPRAGKKIRKDGARYYVDVIAPQRTGGQTSS